MQKYSVKAREIAQTIGLFYLEKNNNDYDATDRELKNLRITDIEVDDNNVTVHLSRPGLLIGRRGVNIIALQAYLKVNVKIVESDHWLNWLTPIKPDDLLDDLEDC